MTSLQILEEQCRCRPKLYSAFCIGLAVLALMWAATVNGSAPLENSQSRTTDTEACAYYTLAMKLINSREGSPNFKEAARLLKGAAEANEPQSQYALGTLYLRGWGVERDPATGYAWLLLSAQPGDKRMAAALRQLREKLPAQAIRKGNIEAKSLRANLSSPRLHCVNNGIGGETDGQ